MKCGSNPSIRFTRKNINQNERLMIQNWWAEITKLYGTYIDYYTYDYATSAHDFFYGEHKQAITVDNWLVTSDGYTASLLNIHTALMPRFMAYVKAFHSDIDDAKKSYYMRVSLKVHRDIETLVDLLTHHWET